MGSGWAGATTSRHNNDLAVSCAVYAVAAISQKVGLARQPSCSPAAAQLQPSCTSNMGEKRRLHAPHESWCHWLAGRQLVASRTPVGVLIAQREK